MTALTGGVYEVVPDGLVGGLVTNLLLVLGVAALVGGVRFRRMDISANTVVLNSKLLLAVMLVAFVPSALSHLKAFQSGELFRNGVTPFDAGVLQPNRAAAGSGGAGSMGVALGVLALTTVVLVVSSEALVDGLTATVAQFKLNNFFTGGRSAATLR